MAAGECSLLLRTSKRKVRKMEIYPGVDEGSPDAYYVTRQVKVFKTVHFRGSRAGPGSQGSA